MLDPWPFAIHHFRFGEQLEFHHPHIYLLARENLWEQRFDLLVARVWQMRIQEPDIHELLLQHFLKLIRYICQCRVVRAQQNHLLLIPVDR